MSTTKEIGSLDASGVRSFIDSFDTLICDCDGVLWRGHTPMPGSAATVSKLHTKYGKRIMYITNNSVKTRAQNVKKLIDFGYPATKDHVLHAGYLCALYLKQMNFKQKAFVVGGNTAIVEELQELGIESICQKMDYCDEGWTFEKALEGLNEGAEECGAVIVGFDAHMSYNKVCKATNYLGSKNCIFLVTDRDASFPVRDGLCLPGTGPLVAALEMGSGRTPIVCGKPSSFGFTAVQTTFSDVQAERTCMVGDRADSDIAFGKACGLKTFLVGSGVHSLKHVREFESEGKENLVPDFFANNLGQLGEMMDKFDL